DWGPRLRPRRHAAFPLLLQHGGEQGGILAGGLRDPRQPERVPADPAGAAARRAIAEPVLRIRNGAADQAGPRWRHGGARAGTGGVPRWAGPVEDAPGARYGAHLLVVAGIPVLEGLRWDTGATP